MPIVRVELPEGVSQDQKASVRLAVKAAVLKTLAPKEAKYDYVAVREVYGEIGDGVPVVTVDLRPGREHERKEALAHAIGAALKETMGIEETEPYVLFRENPAGNHFTGGTPLPEWVPADQ